MGIGKLLHRIFRKEMDTAHLDHYMKLNHPDIEPEYAKRSAEVFHEAYTAGFEWGPVYQRWGQEDGGRMERIVREVFDYDRVFESDARVNKARDECGAWMIAKCRTYAITGERPYKSMEFEYHYQGIDATRRYT